MPSPATPAGTVALHLTAASGKAGTEKPIADNASAVVQTGDCLWMAADETTCVERLVSRDGRASFGEHRAFDLSRFFDLPGGPEQEIDIEGLHADGGYLWITGSHSYARRKPRMLEEDEAAALERLTEVKHEPNRYLVARVPLVTGRDGLPELRAEAEVGGRHLSASCLRMGERHNSLIRALKGDEHLERFLEVPAKENGFDIEGIAAHGDRVFLGMRGPVLRGWAVVLELAVEEKKPGRLRLTELDDEERRYRKHFLDLDGLGVRDLKIVGNDLLILAGPTMDLDGPVQLWRWPDALSCAAERVVPRKRLEMVMDLPFGQGFDHAEGICLFEGADGGRLRLLVAYDNPGAGRKLPGGHGVNLDLFDLP